MNVPDENEIAGLEMFVESVKKKTCTDFTGKPCGAILSDECFACVGLDAAFHWLKEAILEGKDAKP